MGIKGVTYDVNADGTLYYLDEIIKSPKGLSTVRLWVSTPPALGGARPLYF
jgi:hypothetical protein